MFYYVPWIVLMGLSLAASVVLFLWALRSGQFSDQARARYLPLYDMGEQAAAENPTRVSREIYALVAVMGGAAMALIVTLVMAIMNR